MLIIEAHRRSHEPILYVCLLFSTVDGMDRNVRWYNRSWYSVWTLLWRRRLNFFDNLSNSKVNNIIHISLTEWNTWSNNWLIVYSFLHRAPASVLGQFPDTDLFEDLSLTDKVIYSVCFWRSNEVIIKIIIPKNSGVWASRHKDHSFRVIDLLHKCGTLQKDCD